MPAAIGKTWRHRRAQLGLTSDEAGKLLSVSGGALRMIENESRPASLALAYRACRLYQCDIDDLIRDDDKPPPKDEPKVEPKVEPTAPPPRRNGKDDRRRPPRAAEMQAGAA
jgi:DNA-binding XRE family transcriptional regulator